MKSLMQLRLIPMLLLAVGTMLAVSASALAEVCFENDTPCSRSVRVFTSAGDIIDFGEIAAGDTKCLNIDVTVLAISINLYDFVPAPTGNACVSAPTACSNSVCLVGRNPVTYRIVN